MLIVFPTVPEAEVPTTVRHSQRLFKFAGAAFNVKAVPTTDLLPKACIDVDKNGRQTRLCR